MLSTSNIHVDGSPSTSLFVSSQVGPISQISMDIKQHDEKKEKRIPNNTLPAGL